MRRLQLLLGIRIFFCLILFQLFGFQLLAQSQLTVTGKLTDVQGNSLSSATVTVKNGNSSTTTDQNGKYNILVNNESDTLVFSFIGYNSTEVAVNGRSVINLQLSANSKSLNEVVVVGYGTQKKSDLTGSIVSISEKDIKDYAVPNVSQLLQGKAAGVYVSSNSGQPGDAAVVRIRGFGTVNNNDPLYVVDGQLFDNINNLNPSDIQNIEVLKDASATAIYGSRGSNGVILITTKKARKGESVTSFDSYVGGKSSYNAPRMQNSDQFYDFIKTAYENSGQTLDPKFKQQYDRGFNTDWWKEESQTGLSQNYNLSIRNGGEKSRSYYSLGYLNDEGAIITTKFTRLSLKINNEFDLSSHLTMGVHLGLAKNENRDAGSLPRFDFILQADPFTPVINPNVDPTEANYEYDKYAPTEWSFNPNPISILKINDRSTKEFNAYGNVYGKLKLFNGLNYFIQYSFENNNSQFNLFNPIYHQTFTEFNLANKENKYNDQTLLTESNSKSVKNIIEQRLNYAKVLGKSSFDVMLATTYESNESEGISGYKTTAPGNEEAFRVFNAATVGAQVSGSKAESAILSYLGRINYSFSDRYLATINFRADGSSVFADGHKWGYFPSFSLGWRINNEKFFTESRLQKLFSNLKLRGGWGQTGNQNISSYAPITLIGTNLNNRYYFGSDFSQGYVPTNIGNPDIKWETSQQTNLGLDAGFLEDRLTLSVDYYIKKTKDMLLRVPLPAISGYPNYPFTNAGDMQNKGFEMSTNYRDNIGKLIFSIGGNISFYKNKVESLGNGGLPLYGSVSKTEVGGPISRFFGYLWEGVFQNQDEIDSYVAKDGSKIQPYATPGDFKFADLNDDGVLDDKDRTYIGNPHPDLIYGFNLGFQIKGFDFSSFFQGTVGNDMWNGLKQVLSAPGAQNSLADAYTKAWFKEGDNATYPKPSLKNDNANYRASSWYVEKGSFLRLQNVQLGYTVPSSVLQKTRLLNSCRFYISGQNLFTITDYSGMDPEIGARSVLNLGYDGIRYPSSRTVLIGVNAQF